MRYRPKSDIFNKPGYHEGAGIADILKTGLRYGLQWLKPVINKHLREGLHSLADYGAEAGNKLIDYGIRSTGGRLMGRGKYIVSKGGATHLAGRGRSRSRSRSTSRRRRKSGGSMSRSRSRSRSRSKSRSRSRGSGKKSPKRRKSPKGKKSPKRRKSSSSRSRSSSPIFGSGRKTMGKKKNYAKVMF